jgi:putative membrane protein
MEKNMAKITFSKEDLEKIRGAVKEAESKTSGEIATSFIKESYDYAVYELLFAVICGFVYFIVMMFFTSGVESIIERMSWDYSTDHLLIFYGLSTFLVIFIFYFLANIPFIDRLIVPKSVMRQKVNERAVRHFMESGVYNTKDRTGILIFISALEHRVELLADKGINEKIPQEKWDSILSHIIDGIKSGQLVKHLSESISECGKLLAEHYPIHPDDVNELKDDIVVLEK